ncbi:alanyl-tRNA editing protein [Planococcus sp. 107-1]|uniref:alanyl-tRNA editing protein n=1 Tax=Planococcus sp. 107-1 TaxID=2908840 RepID=UPI001F4325F2|nr:alanyl-tRNA editing protein [Planococcus sp. 107-1]UJF25492.1 alanyl-tRNA editing protein [Planococcus sp. 107-1]
MIDVKKVDGQILHEVDHPLKSLEIPVELQIDWAKRYQNMQYHTLLHVLSGYMFSQFAALATSSQIEKDYARLELTFPSELPGEITAEKIEEAVNKLLETPHDVKIDTISRDEAEKRAGIIKTTVSLLPPSLSEIRTVEIEMIDEQACGGTHLKNTREIKGFSILQMKKRGKTRMKIKLQLKNQIDELKRQ